MRLHSDYDPPRIAVVTEEEEEEDDDDDDKGFKTKLRTASEEWKEDRGKEEVEEGGRRIEDSKKGKEEDLRSYVSCMYACHN